MAQWQTGTVVERIDWGGSLHSLRIDTAPIAFKAGQFTRFGLTIDGERVARPYSFINPPGDRVVEIHFNQVPDGPLSNRLAQLGPGDRLDIATPPNGFMVLDEVPQAEQLWLLATGTAIGPFLSILAEPEPWQRFETIRLAYGVRSEADLCYRDQLDRLRQQYPQQFRWQACISRESVAGALHGRITTLLENGELERALGERLDGDAVQVMLCGNPAMIEATQALLDQRGLHKNLRRKPGQVTVERYW